MAAPSPNTETPRRGRQGQLDERAYLELRNLIVRGTYRPNQRLVEEELAERLGISRTPVRAALQKLFDQGLVGRDRGGWHVWEHTIEDIHEIYEVRAALEGYLARKAAERVTPEDIETLRGIYEVSTPEEIVTTYTPSELVELNELFHNAIIEAARNSRLSALSFASRSFFFNYSLASFYTQEQLLHSASQHLAVMKAIIDRDGEEAERIMRDHIDHALQIIVSFNNPYR